jgi:hypothetical protein
MEKFRIRVTEIRKEQRISINYGGLVELMG